MGKLTTAKSVLRSQGVAGVLSLLKKRYLDNWGGRQIDRGYGKIIELRGNIVNIEGCKFSLESPAITTSKKGAFIFNQYEWPEREAIRRFLDPALPVVEFGGSVGVVSCLTNRRLLNPQRHVVVEAYPALVSLLRKNRDLNQCRFEILPGMVAYGSEEASFYPDPTNFVASRAIQTNPDAGRDVLKVPTVNLQAILNQYGFDQCTLICDIEGGEADLLRYEAETLRDRVGTLILEVHEWSLGKEGVAKLFQDIQRLGFHEAYSESDTYTFQKKL